MRLPEKKIAKRKGSLANTDRLMRLGSVEIVTGRPTNPRLVLMRPPIIATARRGKENKESNQAGAGKAIVLKQGTDNPGNE